jgi:hypothetical protein
LKPKNKKSRRVDRPAIRRKNFFPEEKLFFHVPDVPNVPGFAVLAIERSLPALRHPFLAVDRE